VTAQQTRPPGRHLLTATIAILVALAKSAM